MFAIVNVLSGIGSWAGAMLMAHFGYKVAIAGAILSVYTACYVAILALLAGLSAAIPANNFTAIALQFFPDAWAVNTAVSSSLGTAALLKTLDTWRSATTAITKSI